MKALFSIIGLGLTIFIVQGCVGHHYYPDQATEPYPRHLHTANSQDIQVFRDGTDIEIVNATARSYRDFKLWINQRYVQSVDALDAGQTIRLSLWDFYDERGETMNAGGFFRLYRPDPLRLVQIEVDDATPLVGLIAIREEIVAEE